MKIHIIENDEYEESKNKTHLRLITNNSNSNMLREDEAKYNIDKYKNNIYKKYHKRNKIY